MFSNLQALLVLAVLIQGLCQGQCFLRCCQVLSPVRDSFFDSPQAHQHGDIFLGMSLRLSQVQILLEAFAPLQDVKPGLGQVICVIGRFSVPGTLLGYSPLQDPLEWRIIPAVEGRRLRRIKCFIYAIVIEFCLPGRALISPSLSLLAGQVRTQDRFRPGSSEITEEPASFAIRVVEILPIAHVFFCDGLKDSERLLTIVRFDKRPGLLNELSNLVNRCPNMPVRFGRTHTIQTVNAGSHLAAYCLRIDSNSGFWCSLLWRSCWLRC